ncbi:hypothetical protein E2C01_015255 [Portunus trituberculatus]|uniref:Uncharacterized protein n=1 Tax=Portunus trituberculatus TaxID=210409 RepID=A0A5B7DM37_PORTR|nr:hypothetical protein [Portunus trituberculatus]
MCPPGSQGLQGAARVSKYRSSLLHPRNVVLTACYAKNRANTGRGLEGERKTAIRKELLGLGMSCS